MNRLEIALELYKFGKADTIEECFVLADEFEFLDTANQKGVEFSLNQSELDVEELDERHFYHINNILKEQGYIEFEMPNSKARIYLLDNIEEAEKGFKTSDIKASSENKESGLGLTIFKK
jgi:hypothetical protein